MARRSDRDREDSAGALPGRGRRVKGPVSEVVSSILIGSTIF